MLRNLFISLRFLSLLNFYVRKTLGCVNHENLLAKLHFNGIRGLFEEWFSSCLTNSRQRS